MALKSSSNKDLIIIKLCLVRNFCKIDFFLPYDIVINQTVNY